MNYLTKDLKEQYESSLSEVIDCHGCVGKIDDGLEEYFISITQSKNIRTVFSKEGNYSMRHSDLYGNLWITYTKEVEKKLNEEVAPNFISNFNRESKSYLYRSFEKSRTRKKRNTTEENCGLKSIINSNYFNVAYLVIDLKGGSEDLHDKFWRQLDDNLSKL